MALNFRDIEKEKPGNRLFFFDANVWLFIINEIPHNSKDTDPDSRRLSYRQQPYIDFTKRLLNSATSSDEEGNEVYRKVIAMHSILLTEVFNAHLRSSFELYKKELLRAGTHTKQQIDSLKYKEDYRNKTDHYIEAFQFFQAELYGYDPFIEIITDESIDLDIIKLLGTLPLAADFNDRYYSELCRRNNYILVTDDHDFSEEAVVAITGNRKLLQKAINQPSSSKKAKSILHQTRSKSKRGGK
ncbi:hypothetical protein [Hymenobacter sp. GOD-10R]|uniref:hypothetical protein n=1 Tax=Hymenobacter sp. GOD-10R TaxID=3093922 RepID=UPI002D76FA3B|nr:hypothetical protein [Hymenobacter sp. GOD-10R]WRQ28121.1 hypothetical protein SD425_23945 [Hymenobacter sp. GOD-10R]